MAIRIDNQNDNQKSVKQIGCHFFLNIERCHSERSRVVCHSERSRVVCHSERSRVFCHSERGTSRGIDVTRMFPISSEERVEKS